MTSHDKFAGLLSRLSTATSAIRVRAYDEARAERNGDERVEGLEEVIARLERVVEDLEATLA